MSENAVSTAAKKAGQKVKVTFKTITDPARRRVGVAVLVGIIAGIFSGIIKFGWEVPFPPRTPERNATNPPQALLEQIFGMSPETSHATYSYLGNNLPYMSFIIHFSFAIFFAVLYCVVAEYWPKIKLWQGAVFGIVLDILFHVIIMPAMGIVPAPWNQPFGEHFSEFFGHIIWLWSIELVRRDLRNRITGEPDAEYPVEARPHTVEVAKIHADACSIHRPALLHLGGRGGFLRGAARPQLAPQSSTEAVLGDRKLSYLLSLSPFPRIGALLPGKIGTK